MRRSNTHTLGEALREYIRQAGIGKKLKEVDIVSSWEELLGKTVMHYTRKIYLSKGVLYIELSSPVVKNELFMMREEIRKKMNEKAGEELVLKIVFR